LNYRHAFHAGNHTEVFKHAVLTLILEHLLQKPNPFAVLDTHGGLGVYDLDSEEATRTNERYEGVDRVFGEPLAAASTYSKIVKALNGQSLRFYPGSPELVRQALRRHDRLIVCELHPEDGAALKARYRKDGRVAVHARDGYEAVGALLPPQERRGLVFIDPPFEQRNEIDKIASALRTCFSKWGAGIIAVWYPIKDSVFGDQISSTAVLAGFKNVLRTEFCPFPRDSVTLAGSGLVICNSPWSIDERIRCLCRELSERLGYRHITWSVEPVVPPSAQPQ
jgi:23S rRNA (adenine2030-N6)-methyltransferase